MGFYTYIIPTGVILEDNIELLVKKYFILDKIDINYVRVNDTENINVDVRLHIYNSYEERLVRDNLLMSIEFSIQGLIDKSLSENLWTTCYLKIKELILNQNIQYLKEALNILPTEKGSLTYDPITGIETATILSDDLTDNENTVDTIPTEYQYLLEIEDHFN